MKNVPGFHGSSLKMIFKNIETDWTIPQREKKNFCQGFKNLENSGSKNREHLQTNNKNNSTF